jgi:hypothetical protein
MKKDRGEQSEQSSDPQSSVAEHHVTNTKFELLAIIVDFEFK